MIQQSHQGSWVVNAFRDMGVDTNLLLSKLPKEMASLLKHPDNITPDDLNCILLECENQTLDEHFGLHLIDSVDPGDMGLYSYLLLNASTIGELLTLAERYYPIFYRNATLEVVKRRKVWRFIYRRTDTGQVDERHDNEWTLGFFVKNIRIKFGADWSPLKTTFKTGKPNDTEELERVFGNNVSFGQALNCFEVDASLVDVALKDSDRSLLKVIREQADMLLNSYVAESSVESHVRLHMMREIEFGMPRADTIAHHMGMSLSTFKRYLARSGLGFRALRDSVMMELAKSALVETRTNVGLIGVQLGYSEVSAFNHAFSRLAGCSPKEYRRRTANK